MGWQFRKSINLGKGFRLNISKSGIGVSGGVKGARVSVGPRGVRRTFSIPGTGISHTKTYSAKKLKRRAQSGCAAMLLSLAGLLALLLVFILL